VEPTPPSKSTSRELTEKAIEAGLSMIPIAGSPAAIAFAYAVGDSTTTEIAKRFIAFISDPRDSR
jgi:tetrahydromethanopterin S-methyltransferase subunit D